MSRVVAIQCMQKNPVVVHCAAFEVRIVQLGLLAWQHHVKSDLFWLFLYGGIGDVQFNAKTTAAVETLLRKYEQMERISLLEQAIWKAVCCIAIPDNAVAKNDYHSWQEWARNGWKSGKSTKYKANETGIIITSVMPFLGKP